MANRQQKTETGGFFQRLMDSIFKSSDPEAEKRRIMKGIAKDLSKTKFKFYKYNGDEVQPAFAKTFYAIYKTVAPANSFFQTTQNEKALQNLVMHSLMSNKQLDLIEKLSEENIVALSKTATLQQLNDQVQNWIEQFVSDFDSSTITKIDTVYTQLLLFKAFCAYDYYFMLKKFDSSMRELDFNSAPQFEPINGKYIVEDLKDFMSIAWVITESESWSDLFAMLKKIRDIEPIPQNTWLKLLTRLREIKRSQVFEMMLRLIQQEPTYQLVLKESGEHITDQYIGKIRHQAEIVINELKRQQKTSKIDSLASSIFGTTSVQRMKNYTEEQSLVFEKRNLGAFVYHQPMNYAKAFILDYIKKDVRELSDLVLVRGKWATAALSTSISDSYHAILELSDKILEFDESLAESSTLSGKLKNLITRCERDKEAMNILNTVLGDINDSARAILVTCVQNLVIFAKNIKMLVEDYQKQRPELITNWKELEHFADKPVNTILVSVYKQIYNFVTLMQSFLN
ncbi:MAG: hypothetical protein J6B81_05270 [Spirochaetaceae bacterium]|nr:hypothetical protein [Spirochaetaceae bacterium]